MRVIFILATECRNFLTHMASLMVDEGHEVTLLGSSIEVVNIAKKTFPNLEGKCFQVTEFAQPPQQPEGAVAEAVRIEEQYDTRCSFLLSQDRALGQGYLFNAAMHPHIKRSRWSQEKKLCEVINDIHTWEEIDKKFSPDVAIAAAYWPMAGLILSKRDAPLYNIAVGRVGSRFAWVDTPYTCAKKSYDEIAELVSKYSDNKEFIKDFPEVSNYTYEQDEYTVQTMNSMKISYGNAFVESCKEVCRSLKKGFRLRAYNIARRILGKEILRGKTNSYEFFGWIKARFRAVKAYRLICKHGKTPADMVGKKFIYIPLHLEPERALQAVSAEFNNSLEMIGSVSRSAPADTIVVVREHPLSYGVRTPKYHDMLLKIGNVELAHPDTHAWEWIKNCSMVATITGTTGFEAVNFRKPILVFGMHNPLSYLPTVRYVNGFADCQKACAQMLSFDPESPAFELSRNILMHVLYKASFEIPANHYTMSMDEAIKGNVAAAALANLKARFSKFFDTDTSVKE